MPESTNYLDPCNLKGGKEWKKWIALSSKEPHIFGNRAPSALWSSVHPPPGHGQVHDSMGREAVTHLDNRH